jgi:heme exporter protein A
MIAAVEISEVALQRGERVLLRGFCMRLAAGEAAALTGANGSGKTTLLRAVAGLVRPSAGQIAFEGPAGALEADDARRFGCHLMGHQDGLKGGRTALEELEFQVRWSGGAAGAGPAAAARLGLSRQLALPVRALSAGQRRRLALARLLAAPRALWLLDEPLAPLDRGSRALMGEVMAEHLAGGGLILAAVHDPLPLPARVVELGAA